MINMDMIGRTKPVPADWLGLFGQKDKLVVYGTGTGTGFDKLAEDAARKADFRLYQVAASASNSDNHAFYLKKIPVLFLFTGLHGEYHRPDGRAGEDQRAGHEAARRTWPRRWPPT